MSVQRALKPTHALAQALTSQQLVLGLRTTPAAHVILRLEPQGRLLGASRNISSIKFLGKDRWKNHSSEAGPHPAAPKELKDHFNEFHQKSVQDWTPPPQSSQANAGSSSGSDLEFWELPTRFQRTIIEEPEMACVESGGAFYSLEA